jgi:hypothetical protein
MSFNPYAAPESNLSAQGSGGSRCWRVGPGLLFVMPSSDLPPRCVKCNEPAVRPVKLRKMYWHSGAWYLLILLNILIYAIAAMAVRKRVDISPGLCQAHARRRAWFVFGAFAAIIVLVFGGLVMISTNGQLAAVMLILGIIAMFVGAIGSRIITPIHIDERGARFKGCSEAFLQSLDGNRPY